MENQKTILVFTPTLGEKKSLNRTIKSVSSISNGLVEHIIVCPKKNYDKLKKLYKENKIFVEPDHINGIFESLNWALNNINDKYEYFTYINDDDYWLPDMYDLIKYSLNSNKDIIYSKNIFIDEEKSFQYNGSNFPNTKLFCDLCLSSIPQFTQQSVLIRYETLKENNFFDISLNLNADTDLFYRMIYGGASTHYINVYSSAYSLGPGRLTSSKKERINSNKKLLKKHIKTRRNRMIIMTSIIIFRIYNLRNYCSRFFKKYF